MSEAADVLKAMLAHAERKPHHERGIAPVEWAATFGPMARKALGPAPVQALDAIVKDIEDGHDLQHYAAAEAAKVLAGNWKAAVMDGASLFELARDVDHVIVILAKFKGDVLNHPAVIEHDGFRAQGKRK